jgi:hypothetical protein
MNANTLRAALATVSAATLVGCNMTGALEAPEPVAAAAAPKVDYTPTSEAGVQPSAVVDSTRLSKLIVQRNAAGANGVSRSDPFALTTQEKSYERLQDLERIFGSSGGFGTVPLTQKPVVEEEVVPPEEQPYRRLSGIVVGDSVLAILEEGGVSTIVTPGMKLPNSPWRVASIDQDKAVLVRSGKVKPSQVIVRLETPPFGTATGPNGGDATGGYPGGPGAPGRGPGGYPGGPGGYPGAPGGRGGRGPEGD